MEINGIMGNKIGILSYWSLFFCKICFFFYHLFNCVNVDSKQRIKLGTLQSYGMRLNYTIGNPSPETSLNQSPLTFKFNLLASDVSWPLDEKHIDPLILMLHTDKNEVKPYWILKKVFTLHFHLMTKRDLIMKNIRIVQVWQKKKIIGWH